MALADSLIQFFGINLLTSSSTFVDLLNVMLRIAVGIWITFFIIRSMFLITTIGGRKYY